MKATENAKGIDKLKGLVSFLCLAVEKISTLDADRNGKISLIEAITLVTSLGFKIPGVYESLPEVKEEWKDLTPAEIEELARHFEEVFDLPKLEHGKVEAIVKKAVNVLVYNANAYKSLKDLLAAE